MSNWPALLTGVADEQEPIPSQVFGQVVADTGVLKNLTVNGTITLGAGGVFRTAPSGQRVEMAEGLHDRLNLYQDGADAGAGPGYVLAENGGAGPWMYFQSPYDDAAPVPVVLMLYAMAGDPHASLMGDLDPDSDNAYDLGDATSTWRALYAYAIYDEAGNLRLDTSTMSFGANDSGGAGLRAVCVPNA